MAGGNSDSTEDTLRQGSYVGGRLDLLVGYNSVDGGRMVGVG